MSGSNGSSSSNRSHSSSSSPLLLSNLTTVAEVLQDLTQRSMKNSLPLVAGAVVLLLILTRVQGIRLEAESHEAFSNQMVDKSRDIAVNNSDSEPLGEKMEESFSEEKDRIGHRLPEIHVDYYGPRGHKPRHH